MKSDLENAYRKSAELANSHYENFPVISLFVKKKLRKHIAVIYKFARDADDIADEGKFSQEERIFQMETYKENLSNALQGNPSDEFWYALDNTIRELNLNPKHFYNLLIAFRQDIHKSRYKNFEEIIDYCRNSANPVGRLILELNGIYDENIHLLSDHICTALQLTNFYQDVSVDLKKDRIYLPTDELQNYNLTEEKLFQKNHSDNYRELLKFQVDRTDDLFINGKEILNHLSGRLKIQIKWTILGGQTILSKIRKLDYDTLNYRPTLSKSEYLQLMIKSLF